MTITEPFPAQRPNLTAITGGIGAGKSVVARIVAAMGYDVYDCDSRARDLMAREEIICALAETFGTGIFNSSGELIRLRLAEIVFNDSAALERLNAITHSAVRADLGEWAAARSEAPHIFVETAILYQSDIDRMVARVWEVTAPPGLRLKRVMARSALTREQALARIGAQDAFVPQRVHPAVTVLVNDGVTPLLPAIRHTLNLT